MLDMQLFENTLQPHRRIILEYEFGDPSLFSYLFGNTKPLNIDMSECAISPIRCLFLGSGDLRNTLQLVQTTTPRDWEFHLVDINPCIVARNLIVLELLNDDTVSNNTLWSIWYDFPLEKCVYSKLKTIIQTLHDSDLVILRKEDRPIIKKTFSAWLNLCDSKIDQQKVRKHRRDHLSACAQRMYTLTLDELVARIRLSLENSLSNVDNITLNRAQDEIQCYMNDGTTGPKTDRCEINVTMLQPTSAMYTGHYCLHPYLGYVPLESSDEQRQFRQEAYRSTYPLFVYCQQQLEKWIVTYRQSRQRIKWHFYCGDALNVALFSMPSMEFDLIHTSNLCDHVDHLNLLVTCVHLLRHRPWAQIITQSMKWHESNMPFQHYVLQIFNGIETSWFPSLLGLIYECVSTRETYSLNTGSINSSSYQMWKLPMNNNGQPNLRLDGTDSNIATVLRKLANRCFYLHVTKRQGDQGTGHCTSLTYYLLLRQYVRRNCVEPQRTLNYLLERTFGLYRAYATSLCALHTLLSEDEVVVCTPRNIKYVPLLRFDSNKIHTPALQLILFNCDENRLKKFLLAMRAGNFRATSHFVAENGHIKYDLFTGNMTLLRDPMNPVQFHLLDDFAFQLSPNFMWRVDHSLTLYFNIVYDSKIQFVLPVSFQSTNALAVLIDVETWYPFAYFEFDRTIAKSSISALMIRDTICSCFADTCDRSSLFLNNIRILKAIEETSNYQILLQLSTDVSLYTFSPKLESQSHILVLAIKFSSTSIKTFRFAFNCPLKLEESEFKSNCTNNTFNIKLVKDIDKMAMLSILKPELSARRFNFADAKRWPPPRLANGNYLDPQSNLPSPLSVGLYDEKTSQIVEELSQMFTLTEHALIEQQSDELYGRDPEFDLRESIKNMFLRAFSARLRWDWYTTKNNTVRFLHDIRTYGDILFLYDGIFDCENRPILAVTYIDMEDIDDKNTVGMTQLLHELVASEMELEAQTIKNAHRTFTSDFSNIETHFILASKDELILMREILRKNSERTESLHRKGLLGPWCASFIEIIRCDKSSVLSGLELIRNQACTIS